MDKKRKEMGYSYHICSGDKEGRFVDLLVSKEQLTRFIEQANSMLELDEEDEARKGEEM